ncbi:MAG: hypothetical protein NVSMB9_11670 [Isosphaeraceae bacterium]
MKFNKRVMNKVRADRGSVARLGLVRSMSLGMVGSAKDHSVLSRLEEAL